MGRWPRLAVARRVAGTGVVASGAASVYLYNTDPSFERSVRFWRLSGPIVAHYFFERLRAVDETDRQERFQRLHAVYAPAARGVVEELRGMFVKVAQVMSVRPEVVPDDYRREFRKLQGEVPPVRWEPIREVLERDLGAPVSELFDEIDEVPLGAASIGQAHRVVWQGKPAVVKVQYPDAAAMLRADFRCLAGLLWLVNRDALVILRQVWQQFSTELDYRSEACNLQELHEAFKSSPEFSGCVVVPASIPELTAGNVIGMEFLPGPKLEMALRARLEALGIEIGSGGVGEWLAARQRQGFTEKLEGETAGEPASNLAPEQASSPWWKQLGKVALKLVGLDVLMWLARGVVDLRQRSSGANNPSQELRSALRLLLDAHGFQLFFCPLFNGDPHPGNILMLPDGRIGLIDFGQCKRMTREEKAGIANLLLAVSKPASPEADEQVAEAFEATGVRTKNGDRQFMALLPRLMFSRMQPEWFQGGTLKEVLGRDGVVEFPIHLVMAYRTSVLLRGLCLVLQENASVAEAWSPWAEKWLKENASPA